jgi:hypothetical protein
MQRNNAQQYATIINRNLIISGLSHIINIGTYYFFNLCGGTLGTAATIGLVYQPRMRGEGDCGEIGGTMIGRENRSTQRKPVPAPLSTPQIPHD